MLKKIEIENYILIEKATIEFDTHLNVISGETGSGKSIILNALESSFGKHGFTQQIKPGKKIMRVSSVFNISNNNEAKKILKQLNIKHNNEVILTREMYQTTNNSQAYINDTQTTVQNLKKLSQTFIEIHGQHNNQLLFNSKQHVTLLDQYINDFNTITEYQATYDEYQKSKNHLDILYKDIEDLKAQKDYLLFSKEELDNKLLTSEKYEEVREIIKNLENNQFLFKKNSNLISHFNNIENHLESSEKELSDLIEIKKDHEKDLDNIISIKENINSIKEKFYNLSIPTTNNSEIDSYHTKLSNVEQLKKKYNKNIDELQEMKKDIELKLSIIDEPIDREELIKKTNSLKEKSLNLAKQIHKKRIEMGQELSFKINQLFKELSMGSAEFFINIQENKNDKDEIILNKNGIDSIEFLYKPSIKHPFKKLSQIASGGEVSRIMLAIQSILLNFLPNHTIVFDEIDTGIGGETAISVGKVLSELSQNRQVIVITHLPQIARCSHHHFYVHKSDDKNNTISYIKKLTPKERIQEMARMLFGNKHEPNRLNIAKQFIEEKDQ